MGWFSKSDDSFFLSTVMPDGQAAKEMGADGVIGVSFDYAVSKWARVFISGQNMLNGLRVTEQRFAERPGYASLSTSNSLGRTLTIGVTGEFGDLPFRLPWSR